MRKIEFECLACGKLLFFQQDKLTCQNCNSFWPVINGVPHFVKEAPYWGEVSQNHLKYINEQMEERDWKDIFRESNVPEVREAFSMISNLKKANWHLLLDLDRESVILDVGAGSGVLSQALSYDYAHVVALEPVLERIEFMKTRFQQEQRDNITLVRGDVLNLPFPEGSFDLVVMSGVLEWVPLSRKNENPRNVQVVALKNLWRVLKYGGILSLGIENRVLPNYFLGKKDPHCELPFVTILPRRLADTYSRIRTGQPYRNYLYSFKGYEKLLMECGFSNIEIYSSIPSYNDPRDIIPLKKNIYNFYLKYIGLPPITWKRKVFLRFFQTIGLIRYLGYSFIIFAIKK